MLKKDKKERNIWKYEQKWTKFENILKKDRWLRAINKLLEKAKGDVCTVLAAKYTPWKNDMEKMM